LKMMFLVDGDNNIGNSLNGIEILTADDTVLIFHKKGMALTKIKNQAGKSKANVQYIESVKDGKNSIDFQIITELGVLVGKNEIEYGYIISQDKGYSPAIEALKNRYIKLFKEVDLKDSIEDCLKLSFILKAGTKQELCNSFTKEFGTSQGSAIYNHIKSIFIQQNDKAE
jgi:hypothetical protein